MAATVAPFRGGGEMPRPKVAMRLTDIPPKLIVTQPTPTGRAANTGRINPGAAMPRPFDGELSARRALVDKLIARHQGRIANTAGDSVLAEFVSVLDARASTSGGMPVPVSATEITT